MAISFGNTWWGAILIVKSTKRSSQRCRCTSSWPIDGCVRHDKLFIPTVVLSDFDHFAVFEVSHLERQIAITPLVYIKASRHSYKKRTTNNWLMNPNKACKTDISQMPVKRSPWCMGARQIFVRVSLSHCQK